MWMLADRDRSSSILQYQHVAFYALGAHCGVYPTCVNAFMTGFGACISGRCLSPRARPRVRTPDVLTDSEACSAPFHGLTALQCVQRSPYHVRRHGVGRSPGERHGLVRRACLPGATGALPRRMVWLLTV